MADFNHGNVANLTVAGNDLSDWVTNVSTDLQREIKDVRPIGGNPVSKVVGPYSGTISVECGYDKVLDAIIAPLFLAAVPTTSTFDHEPSGTGGSNRSVTGSALVASLRYDTSGSDTSGLRFTLAIVGTVTNAV